MKKSESSASTRPVTVAVVGIGGYGHYYLKTLLEQFPPGEVRVDAIVDPLARKAGFFLIVKNLEIPIFDTLPEYYQSIDAGEAAELVVISSPIHFHVSQSCAALQHGSHVLCEKPIGATVQEADRLIATRDAVSLPVSIGYQWSFSDAVRTLKRDIIGGLFGTPRRFKTLCLWPRGGDYYGRNDWAGRKRDDRGDWVLDSPANNAMAHFLHNMFYLLGSSAETSASPLEVTAELYRANDIENFDTVACRVMTTEGVELLFYGSHAVSETGGPIFSLEFEDAIVRCGPLPGVGPSIASPDESAFGGSTIEHPGEILAVDGKGNEKHYGSPEADHQFRKLFEAVAATREPAPPICPPEAARSQTLCINGLQESVPEIATFPPSMIEIDDERGIRWVKKLAATLLSCYGKNRLPGDMNVRWANQGSTVDLRGYTCFPGGKGDAVGDW